MAVLQYTIEELIPVGASLVLYEAPSDFQPNTTRLWRNGIVVVAVDDDGFTEVGLRRVQLKEAALPGETFQLGYKPL